MEICHISDWHGKWYPLPAADLYICTGDMLMNYPKMKRDRGGYGVFGAHYAREIIPERESRLQAETTAKLGRRFLGSPDAPVVVCRGNHDFIDLGPIFGGEVYEIGTHPTTFDILGLRIGGFRGIPFIEGEWSDELMSKDLEILSEALPGDLDILVTHTPAAGILDGGFGSPALSRYINRRFYTENELPMHCFGHIHSCKGTLDNGTLFSNAATGHNMLKFNK